MARKVLIIEDYDLIQETFAHSLGPKLDAMGIELLQALNAEEARDYFYAAISDFIVISFDGRLPKKQGGEVGFFGAILAREFSKHVRRETVLIAASSNSDSNADLMLAGCSQVCPSKDKLLEIILNIVGLC